MKSERRHELQTNSLALWLRWRLPQLAQQYGTRALLGLVFLLLVVVLVRYRINAPKVAAAEAAAKLAVAKELVGALKMGEPPGNVASVTEHVMNALDRSDDPWIHAQGNLIMGDYYWALACYPDRPEAATRPELFRPALKLDQLLNKAEEAYRNAISEKKDLAHVNAAAHLGLAAVAEQRAFDLDRQTNGSSTPPNTHWNTAKEHYQAVVNDPGAPPVLKNEAQWHLDRLPQVQLPVWLVASTQPAATQTAESQQPHPTTSQPLNPGSATSATTRPAVK